MRRQQSIYTTFVLSVILTAVWSVATVKIEGGAWTDAAKVAPLFFAMIFFSMLATSRLSTYIANRVAARADAKAAANRGPVAVPPTSDRIDHNQRRRQRADRARTERRRR